jgi:phosphatidylinositol-3-phosphatase
MEDRLTNSGRASGVAAVALKVPEVTVYFWIVKLLTTAMGAAARVAPQPSRIPQSRHGAHFGVPLALVVSLVCLLSACAPQQPPSFTPGAGPIHFAAAASTSPTPATGKVVLIVMENREYDQLIGNSDAPFINQLADEYTLVDSAYAITHPSLPNYLALLSGDTFGITSDCTSCFVSGPNLVDSLDARGRSWKAYMEDMPGPCFMGDSAGNYALKHNPFLYFQDIRTNAERCQRIVPLTQLERDLASGSVPDFVWISPNLVHDMHDAPVGTGDAWLATFVPGLLGSAAWQEGGTLIITWDEGTTDAGCCGGAAGGHILTLVIQPGMAAGARVSQPVTHYSTLRTIEDLLQVDRVGATNVADAIPGVQGVTP